MPSLSALVRFVNALNEGIGRIVSIVLLLIILLVVVEVVLRYGFNAPTTWGGELITFIFAGYILLGGGYTLLHRDHVNMDIVYSRFSPRGRAWVDVATAAFVFIYCWVLLRESADMAIEALELGRHTGTDWNPPQFPVLLSLPVGAFLLLLQAAAKFVSDLVLAITGRELAP